MLGTWNHRRGAGLAACVCMMAGSAFGMDASTSLALGDIADEPAPAAAPAPAAMPAKGGFLLSDQRFHSDPEILWKGFLSGLRGFEHFYEAVGNPLYFESPFINTQVRALFLHHEFDDDSILGGGQVNVYAVQARIAVTERIAIIATKDGWSQLDGTILPDAGGWNDIALGLKGAFYVDRENDFVATASFRWMWGNGDSDVLMGGSQELSPGITIAKGWGDFHLIAGATYRFPTDGDKGNEVFQWDAHFDYDLSSLGLKGIAPILEFHGLHYMSDGERTPLPVGGLDYTNLGSTDVEGSSVVWAGIGARIKFTPNFSVGATYEIGLTNHKADIMSERVTIDAQITW